MQQKSRHSIGDIVMIKSHRVGGSRRRGDIVEVLGTGESEHYRVRWEDDRETIFYPGSSDATIERPPRRPTKAPSASASGETEQDYEGSVLTHEP